MVEFKPFLNNSFLSFLKELKLGTNLVVSSESKEYKACSFFINSSKVISRQAKLTPKKSGFFVSVWKRTSEGITAPYSFNDKFDFFVININLRENQGVFIFSKQVLIKNHIISTKEKEGKRGFRLYLPNDTLQSKQAQNTQKWQMEYYINFNDSVIVNSNKFKTLFNL